MSLNGSTSREPTSVTSAGHTVDVAEAAMAVSAEPIVPALKSKRPGSRIEALRRDSCEFKLLQERGEAITSPSIKKK